MIPTWPQDSQVGNHSMSGTDDGDGLLSGEEAVLIQSFMRGQPMPFAEKPLQIILGYVTVSSGNIDHQPRHSICHHTRLGSRTCPAARNGITYKPFDQLAV